MGSYHALFIHAFPVSSSLVPSPCQPAVIYCLASPLLHAHAGGVSQVAYLATGEKVASILKEQEAEHIRVQLRRQT